MPFINGNAQRDALLGLAQKHLARWRSMPVDDKDHARAALVGLGLTIVTFGAYVTMLVAWFRVYHSSFTGTVFMFVIVVALGFGASRFHGDRAWMVGPLVAQGAVVGLLVGFMCYFQYLVYYFTYEEMRVYTNIAASEPASEFRDANMFLFTSDTRLDAMRTVGFQSRFTGQTYCVAPIVDPTMGSSEDIQFYAVGENCCLPRSEYECDESADSTVRSGLVILEPEDIVRPYMRWAVSGSVYPRYERAVRLQEATYYGHAAPRPKLIRWVRDPRAFKDGFYWNAVGTASLLSTLYFLVCVAFGAYGGWLHYKWLTSEAYIAETRNRYIPSPLKPEELRHH